MSTKDKIIKEAKSIFWTSLYFLAWFGSLMLIKVLLLEEYHIQFYNVSALIIGALVVAKSVLIMEAMPVSKGKYQPAWAVLLKRTLLFMVGVFIILVLEKSIEARHEYGGILNAGRSLFHDTNMYHVWVNTLCVFGALLIYNIGSLLRLNLGKGGIRKLLLAPYPDKTDNTESFQYEQDREKIKYANK
jgi:hypothetical protein